MDKSTDKDEANHWLNIEGITFNADIRIQKPSSRELYVVKDLCMTRCDIKNFDFDDYYSDGYYRSTLKNCSFINCRITDGSATVLKNVMRVTAQKRFGGEFDADEIGLPIEANGLILPCGITGRWYRKD